jgi:acyl-CoA thioester hydrolase
MSVNPQPTVLTEHEIEIRVRYQETDGQGRVHHSNYTNYFEVARVEMLRASGRNYKDLEAAGIFLVVRNVTVNFHRGAKYDDLLTIKTRLLRAKGVRIQHSYQVLNQNELVVDGETTVAAVCPEGKVVRLPDWLQIKG